MSEKLEFNQLELDAIGEVSNICLGTGATSLGMLTRQVIDITPPKIKILKRGDVIKENSVKKVFVKVTYVVGIEGCSMLVLNVDDAKMIADMMMGSDGHGDFFKMDFNEMHISAISEAMNQMMGAAATSMSTMLNKKTDISTPTTEYMEKGTYISHEFPNDERFVEIGFHLKIGSDIDIRTYQLFPHDLAKAISDLFLIKKANNEI